MARIPAQTFTTFNVPVGGRRVEVRETRDKIAALLTPEQKTKWEEMLGSPFTGKLESGGFSF